MGGQRSGAAARGRVQLLPLVVIVVSATIAVVLGSVAVDRIRSDTPVAAVTVGEPGCVTDARFTDPAGQVRLVSLRVYKGNCLNRDPGEAVTVYYDADDPSTHAATRSWWWPSLLTVAGLSGTVAGVRALLREPVRQPLPDRGSRSGPLIGPVPSRTTPGAGQHYPDPLATQEPAPAPVTKPGEGVSERLERWVLRTFTDGSATQVLETLASLPERGASWDGPGRERIQAALVLQTGGDWSRFQSMVALAGQDWRDALVAADLGNEDWPRRLDAALD